MNKHSSYSDLAGGRLRQRKESKGIQMEGQLITGGLVKVTEGGKTILGRVTTVGPDGQTFSMRDESGQKHSFACVDVEVKPVDLNLPEASILFE